MCLGLCWDGETDTDWETHKILGSFWSAAARRGFEIMNECFLKRGCQGKRHKPDSYKYR